MAVSSDYLDLVLEQLAPVGPLTSRKMFGGVGLYAQGLFFALIDDDTLYFKGDETLGPDFAAAGSTQFAPFGVSSMAYWSAPAEALDEPDLMVEWARRSIAVAAARKARKP
ncbi:TfoX/Sxy family protein [Caulobacter sp. DWP3-1-3b2]|uniref:TfoX/Sxy family protein n=1 Tax=Caulobacter sp. DWP3-1-3b2 TaxID=2804643 RepID=UPI003CEFEB2E